MSTFPYMTDKEYPYLLTVAIPTRKRIGALVDCLTSIKNKTHNLDRIGLHLDRVVALSNQNP